MEKIENHTSPWIEHPMDHDFQWTAHVLWFFMDQPWIWAMKGHLTVISFQKGLNAEVFTFSTFPLYSTSKVPSGYVKIAIEAMAQSKSWIYP